MTQWKLECVLAQAFRDKKYHVPVLEYTIIYATSVGRSAN